MPNLSPWSQNVVLSLLSKEPKMKTPRFPFLVFLLTLAIVALWSCLLEDRPFNLVHNR